VRSVTISLLFAVALLVAATSFSWAGVPCNGPSSVGADSDRAPYGDTLRVYATVKDCYGEPIDNRPALFVAVQFIGNPTTTDVNGDCEALCYVLYPPEDWRYKCDKITVTLTVIVDGVTLGPFVFQFINSEWLQCPGGEWKIKLSNYGYSDQLLAYKPRWRRAWPWGLPQYYWRDDKLSGEWAAAIYYDQIQTPGIAQGPNTGQPQCEWFEPRFVFPDWVTNSSFQVVSPVQVVGNTATSTITNGQVDVRIDCIMYPDQTAMGRCTNWPFPWLGYVMSDPCVMQQIYTITNVSGIPLTNMELHQFLHSHPGNHNTDRWWGAWEVYDPNFYATGDPWQTYQYDITQWGRRHLWPWLWPWPGPCWAFWGYNYVSLHSDVQPNVGRSPSPWGLGTYSGHGIGKPARPGVHWDVEEDNLNPRGPACTLYPGWPPWPIWGSEVAGDETWLLTPALAPGDSVQHDVLLTIANRPYHGWHWGWDYWYWREGYAWPWWYYPSVHYDWPTVWLDFPYWWYCWYWPRPFHWPIYYGIAIETDKVGQGVGVQSVSFRGYADGPGGGPIQAMFTPDAAVTDSLNAQWPWDGYEWYGYSLRGYEIPTDTMVVYIALSDLDQVMEGARVHVMMGDSVFGWSPDRYDSVYVCEEGSAGIPTGPVDTAPLRLASISPNPFSTTTEISYGLLAASDVDLTIYNIAGRRVKTLVSEHQAPGMRVVRWDGTNDEGVAVSGGIYFCSFKAGAHTEIRKVVLSR
jgi:hypothetical protein